MNRTHLIAVAVLALAGTSAFAGDEFDPLTGFAQDKPSTLTRAEVRAETLAAHRVAPLNVTRDDLMFAIAKNKAPSTVSRAEVRAELMAARAEGTVSPFDNGIDFEIAPLVASKLTREQVREETRVALRNRTVKGAYGS